MTGSTVARVGVGGVLVDEDTAGGDGVTTGDGVAAGGGGPEAHCASTRHAAPICANKAAGRLIGVNFDESSPSDFIPIRRLR
ncbi:hypothetical protein MCNS_11890 [Mycobacterium conspicuum]|uniref:Uncharacterized protein n=1 Tax=Mycobacterium conspicuum TaxID=44010 RepID=A0A1X1THF3_9MYCO|nr:hypothetical protein AWC00_09690 [Mycobacterium conspicuum]BBZ38126.1 hypothetical protein MCNS_11890 [Mycobacterium conspicuum]